MLKTVADRDLMGMELRFWGIAWRDPSIRTTTLAVIPINWVLGWARDFYYTILNGPNDKYARRMEIALNKEFNHGYEIGRTQDRTERMDYYEEATKDGFKQQW